MNEDYPRCFYKYRAVSNLGDLSKNYAIDALLKSEAIFSSRKNFNDLSTRI